MTQLDVHNAKRALGARLLAWGITDDPAAKAGGFIDDLVQQGWQMAPFRESRPTAPKRNEACETCGRHQQTCICNVRADDEPTRGDAMPKADALAAARAALRGEG